MTAGINSSLSDRGTRRPLIALHGVIKLIAQFEETLGIYAHTCPPVVLHSVATAAPQTRAALTVKTE
jgi:hypothetical protein